MLLRSFRAASTVHGNHSSASLLNQILPLAASIGTLKPLLRALFGGKEPDRIGISDRSGRRIGQAEPNRSFDGVGDACIGPILACYRACMDPNLKPAFKSGPVSSLGKLRGVRDVQLDRAGFSAAVNSQGDLLADPFVLEN